MAKRPVWHTDIVVDGQGVGLSLRPTGRCRYALVMAPDNPGARAKKALARFKKAVVRSSKAPGPCTVTEAKTRVSRAIRAVGARWNRWHLEAYR